MEAGDLYDEEMEPAILLVSMLGNEHEAYWKRRQAKSLILENSTRNLTITHAFYAADDRYLRERAELSRPISEGSDRMERLFVWFGRLPLLITAQVCLLYLKQSWRFI